MGMGMVKERAKSFKHQQNEAYNQELKSKHLFSERPEIYATDYTCTPRSNSGVVTVGAVVFVRCGEADDNTSRTAEVVMENEVIGAISGDIGQSVVDIIESENRCGGVFEAEIVSVSELDEHFTVRYRSHEDVDAE